MFICTDEWGNSQVGTRKPSGNTNRWKAYSTQGRRPESGDCHSSSHIYMHHGIIHLAPINQKEQNKDGLTRNEVLVTSLYSHPGKGLCPPQDQWLCLPPHSSKTPRSTGIQPGSPSGAFLLRPCDMCDPFRQTTTQGSKAKGPSSHSSLMHQSVLVPTRPQISHSKYPEPQKLEKKKCPAKLLQLQKQPSLMVIHEKILPPS